MSLPEPLAIHNEQPDLPQFEFSSEIVFITHNDREYECRVIKTRGRILYQVNFGESFLYLTKTINQHGVPFWTSIPQDLKLQRVVGYLGKKLEFHLMQMLCATTTVLK